MADKKAVARNILAWETTGVTETVAAANSVEASQLSVADANETLAQSATVAANQMSSLDAVFERNAGAVAETALAYNDLADSAGQAGKRIGDIPDAPTAPRRSAGAGGRDFDIGNVDTATSALGTLAASLDFAGSEVLAVAGDILGLIDALGPMAAATKTGAAATTTAAAAETTAATGATALTASLLPMVAILGGLAAIGGAVAIGVNQASAAYEDSREAATVAASAITEYNRAIAEGTTTDVAAQLDQANIDLEVATQTRADLLAAQAEAWEQETSFVLGDLGARIRTAFGASTQGAENYSEAIEEQEQAIIEARGQVDGLSRALESSSVAANDAAAAQEAATSASVEAIQSSAALEVERAAILKTASEESVAAATEEQEVRLAALERQRAALMALDQGSDDVVEALAETQSEITNTSETLDFLSTSAADAAEANDLLARSEQRLAEVARETDAALKEIEGADESAAALQERIIENERKAGEKRVDLADRLAVDLERISDRVATDAKSNAKQLAAIGAAETKDLAAISAGAAKDEIKARESLTDFNSKQTKAETKDEADALKDVAKIRADFRKEQKRAEEDLALGLQEAVLSRNVDRIIGLQREAAAEGTRREEDAATDIAEREANAAERQQARDEDRAERQRETTERITEIAQLAEMERAERQRETAAAIQDEKAAAAERATLRTQETADAVAASEKRAAKLNEQNARELQAIEKQVSEELAIKAAATKEILALERERVRVSAGNTDDIVLAEERLSASRQSAVEALTASTGVFEQNASNVFNSIAVNFRDIGVNLLFDLASLQQDVIAQTTANIAAQMDVQMRQVNAGLGVR